MNWYRIASSNKRTDLEKFAKFVFVKGTWIVRKDPSYDYKGKPVYALKVETEEAKYWLAQDPQQEPKFSEIRFWDELKVWNGSICTYVGNSDYYVKEERGALNEE